MRDWIILDPCAGLSGKPLMRAIVRQVSEETAVPEILMMRQDRTKKVALARMMAYARIRHTNRFSYHQIGRFFGRDHSTIVHGVKRHAERALAQGGGA